MFPCSACNRPRARRLLLYGGVAEATDDCDATSHCWDQIDVDGVVIGTCTPFCTGLEDLGACTTPPP